MRKNLKIGFVLILCSLLFLTYCDCFKGNNAKKKTGDGKVKLVLTIVVDQLRADILTRMNDRLSEKGFKYLINKGTWYKDARYQYSNTITAVGHATLSTGSLPSEHGIIGNYWFDEKLTRLLKGQKKPVRHLKSSLGWHPDKPGQLMVGPMQLTSTTIGDELVLASGHRSRVFALSMKDRAAVLTGGYRAKAFWYDSKSGAFVTSDYYYKKNTPAWLKQWNDKKVADNFRNKAWTLFNKDKSTYIFGDHDDREVEKQFSGKRSWTFPHDLKPFKGNDLYWQLYGTPFADRLLFDITKHAAEAEQIGRGPHTDMLCLSFSCTDVIGHLYGPNSLEYEDNILHLDALLAELFQWVDTTVGLENTLIVLSGDHGTDLAPEYRKKLGMPAGRYTPGTFKEAIDARLKEKFNLDKSVVIGYRNPSIYLDRDALAEAKLDLAKVELEAAQAVMKVPGVAIAVTHSQMMAGQLPHVAKVEQLKMMFHPKRSGSILVMQEPFWFLYHVTDADAAMHGAPYSYDTHVPVLFSGPGIKPQKIYRRITPRDIAPTLAQILGIEAPSACSGRPLPEVCPR